MNIRMIMSIHWFCYITAAYVMSLLVIAGVANRRYQSLVRLKTILLFTYSRPTLKRITCTLCLLLVPMTGYVCIHASGDNIYHDHNRNQSDNYNNINKTFPFNASTLELPFYAHWCDNSERNTENCVGGKPWWSPVLFELSWYQLGLDTVVKKINHSLRHWIMVYLFFSFMQLVKRWEPLHALSNEMKVLVFHCSVHLG